MSTELLVTLVIAGIIAAQNLFTSWLRGRGTVRSSAAADAIDGIMPMGIEHVRQAIKKARGGALPPDGGASGDPPPAPPQDPSGAAPGAARSFLWSALIVFTFGGLAGAMTSSCGGAPEKLVGVVQTANAVASGGIECLLAQYEAAQRVCLLLKTEEAQDDCIARVRYEWRDSPVMKGAAKLHDVRCDLEPKKCAPPASSSAP